MAGNRRAINVSLPVTWPVPRKPLATIIDRSPACLPTGRQSTGEQYRFLDGQVVLGREFKFLFAPDHFGQIRKIGIVTWKVLDRNVLIPFLVRSLRPREGGP